MKLEAGRAEVTEITVPAYRGSVRVYTPHAVGGYYATLTCKHNHDTAAHANACAVRLGRYVLKNNFCPEWADDCNGQVADIVSRMS